MRIHPRLRSIVALAAPLLFTREQPQGMQQAAPTIYLRLCLTNTAPSEHSHDRYLRKVNEMLWIDNAINVTDPVFGLLVDSSAERGSGIISDVNCLQVSASVAILDWYADETNADGRSRPRVYKC